MNDADRGQVNAQAAEIYEVRAAIFGLAGRLLADRLTDDMLARLEHAKSTLFGRDEEKIEFSVEVGAGDRSRLEPIPSRVDSLRSETESLQRLDLILHQGDER